MSVLKNTRHEAFVQAYLINGGNGRDAYKAAYPACKTDGAADVNASKLLRNAKVEARLAELQSKSAKRAEITLVGLIEEAAAIQRQATEAGAWSAAIAALTVKAKHAGFWVKRTANQNANVNYAISDKPMSAEESKKRYVKPH